MKKGTKRALVAGGAVVAVALLAGLNAANTRAQAVVVSAGAVDDRIIARAAVVPVEGIAEVRPRVDGRAIRVLVREGDRVEAGALLAEFEADDLRAEVQRREAEKSALSETARSIAEGARAEERVAFEAEALAAKQELDVAESRHRREQALRASGSGTDVSAEEAKSGFEVAKARLAAAEARARLAKAGGRSADVGAAKARVDAADAAISAAKTGLERTRVVAPIAGVVLARRVNAGDTVSAALGSQALFEIADVTKTEVRAEVEEGDALKLAAGCEVELTLPGAGAKVARGVVDRLGARFERRTIGAEDARVRADAQVRAIWITWKEMPSSPAVGQRLEAVIALAPRTVTAMVPRGAVVVRDGRAVVEVPCGPLTCDVPVTLGVADDRNVELHGIDVGTRVVVRR